VIRLSVPGWESLFSDSAGTSVIEVIALWGAVGTVLVAPFTSVAAWLKGHRWSAVIGWLGWALALFALFFPIRLLEDEPAGVWLVENLPSVKTVASFTAVAFLVISLLAAVRLAKSSSWWAQSRYRDGKYQRSVERHGWSKIKAR